MEWVVVLCVAVLVVDVLWGVITRYFSQYVVGLEPSRWTEELARLLLIWVSMLGAAVAFRRRQHLGVDFIASKLDPAAQRLLAIVVEGIVVAFSAVVLVYGGYVLVAETLASGQTTPALGLPMGCVYLAVPVSGCFVVLFSLQNMRRWTAADETPPTTGVDGTS